MVKPKNYDLRLLAKGKDIPLWAIAKKMGMSEPTLYRRWREELSETEKAKIRDAVAQLVQEREGT